MGFNILAWFVMTWFVLCSGMTFEKIYESRGSHRPGNNSLDITMLSGICALTVYAQFFSLFYKVGAAANLILITGCIIATYFFRSNFLSILCEIKNKKPIFLVFVAAALFAMLILGSRNPSFYDTLLYHGQAIRWIEDYGAVKGLGVLHHRLAYSSAFMCLQALFGYRYIFGVELHSVNAYLGCLFLVWAVGSLNIWKRKKYRHLTP